MNDRASSRLSMCLIARDAARTLRPCLESIRPFVDEMIIVDTGSVDDIRQIARQLQTPMLHFALPGKFYY